MNALWNSQGFVVWCRVQCDKNERESSKYNKTQAYKSVTTIFNKTQPYESMNNATVSRSKWEAYDFLYLAKQWPMSFCNMAGVTCIRQIIPNYFTVHGLWPQKNRWQSINCTVLLQHSHRGRGYPPIKLLWYYMFVRFNKSSMSLLSSPIIIYAISVAAQIFFRILTKKLKLYKI